MKYDYYEYKSEEQGVVMSFKFPKGENTEEKKIAFMSLLTTAYEDLEEEINK